MVMKWFNGLGDIMSPLLPISNLAEPPLPHRTAVSVHRAAALTWFHVGCEMAQRLVMDCNQIKWLGEGG